MIRAAALGAVRAATGAVAIFLAGCTLVSDLDRFEETGTGGSGGAGADGGVEDGGQAGMDAGADTGADADAGTDAGPDVELGCANPQTLCVRVEAFSPHPEDLVVIDLVSEDHILRSRAMLDPLSPGTAPDGVTLPSDVMVTDTADVVLPLAIPEQEVPDEGEPHPLHVEIWADHDQDGVRDAPNADHSWKIDELPASGNLVFPHNNAFVDISDAPTPIGGDFVMHLTGMDIHVGKRFEVMVIEETSGRTVGMLRIPHIPSGDFEVRIPGIIDNGGVVHRVEFYADENDNLTYDDQPDDHTWVRFVESGDDGIDFQFDHAGVFESLSYQFDFEE